MVDSGKRGTRSQITIPDDYKVSLDQSPLKQARYLVRNADAVVATDSLDAGPSSGATSGKKRSASPPAINRDESVERELKRSKTFAGENEVRGSSTSGWRLQPFPGSTKPFALPPPSVSGSTTPTKSVGSSPRARSVPPSIPTTPGQVPYLDLSKYRSPTKSAHRVRLMSVPPSSSPVRDGEEVGNTMEEDLNKTPVPRMVVEKVEKVQKVVDHPPPALVVASNSGKQNDDPFSYDIDALPKTPERKTLPLSGSMSPLTPLSSFNTHSRPLSPTSTRSNDDATTDPMNIDPPTIPPPPQPQPKPPSEQDREPRPVLAKKPSHLIPPQPTPLSFPLPSRSPTPPSRRASRSRSVSVEPPIPALPYPLLPPSSNAFDDPVPEPEPVPSDAPTIPDPQLPEKQGLPELPVAIVPPGPETSTPAPVQLPAVDTALSDEKGKGKAKERPPGLSKLPAAKSTKTSRLRSTTTNAGPTGVTRTKTMKGAARPTPISREGRVTRSTTAKSRQADALKEKEPEPANVAAKPKETGGVTEKVEKDNDGKDDKNQVAILAPVTPRPRKSMGFSLPTASSQAKSKPSSPTKPKSSAPAFQTPGRLREPGTSTSMIPVSATKNRIRSKSVDATSRTPAPEPSTLARPDEPSRTIARASSSSSATSAVSSASRPPSTSNQRVPRPDRPASSTGYQRPASLITLSNALDRLNAPIPSRPSTSIGFNHTSTSSTTTMVIDNASSDGNLKGKEKARGIAGALGPVGMGSALKKTGSVTLTSGPLTTASSSVKGKQPETKAVLATKSLSNGPVPKHGTTGLAARLNKVGTYGVNSNVAKRVFGGAVGPSKPGVMGNRVFGKASQKSSLPIVEGSPVKGNGTPMDIDEAVISDDEVEVTGGTMPPPMVPFKVYRDHQPEASTSNPPTAAGDPPPSTGDLADIFFDPMDVEFDPKVHDEAWRKHASRRASYVMHNLSQSLSALPDPPPKRKEKGAMGPPPVPGTRTGLRSANVTTSAPSKDSQGKTTPSASEKSKQETNGSGGSGKKKAPVLNILKSCVVFVDVKTDEGDEAGGLFVDMLKGLGARTLSSVGQTCTHIVFKNGHSNTVKRYRELEHKPKVVGVAWVVGCAEKREKVAEEKYRVDLDAVHIPNFASRRRRSMLPRPPKIQPGGVDDPEDLPGQVSSSFESAIESESSTEVDLSDLPPLERVRRRSMLAKPHGFGGRA